MEAFSQAFVNPLKPKNGSGDEGTLSDLVLSALGAAPPPQPHELLSTDEHELLFGAVEVQVLPLSHMMLEMLEAALAAWDAGTSVGRILFRFAPWLKIYSVAFLRQLEAPQLLQRLGEDRPGFTEFLEAASASCGGQTIDSFLILPVQRVPRFRLLFEQLLKHTPPDHPDYVLCAEALAEVGCKDGCRGVDARSLTNPGVAQVSAVALKLNESLRRFEQSLAMCQVARRFDPPMPELVQPHRRLLREGPLRRLRVSGQPACV